MSTTFIYGLRHPISGHLHYVGRADNPRARVRTHRAAGREGRTRVGQWVQALEEQGLKPELFIIEEVPISEWEEAERRWIAYFRSLGCELMNCSAGGKGQSGPPEEVRQRMRESALQGRRRSGCYAPIRYKLSHMAVYGVEEREVGEDGRGAVRLIQEEWLEKFMAERSSAREGAREE